MKAPENGETALSYEFRTKPFAHQLQTFNESLDKKAFAILWEQGTGKTKVTIDTAAALIEAGTIDAVLVVASNGVHRNWVTDEIPTHCPEALLARSKTFFYQSPKADTKAHAKALEELLVHPGPAWLCFSYNGFTTDKGKKFAKRFLLRRRCLFVLDEAHNIKEPNAKRTKTLVAAGKYAPVRRILTGTPIAQGPLDLYSQLKFLDSDFWKPHGFESYWAYKNHFAEWFTAEEFKRLNGYDPGYDQLVGYRNLEELNAILSTVSSRVLKEDVLDLPPKLYSKRYVEMTSEQTRLYKDLRNEFTAELEDGTIVDAPLAIVRLLRLQQIACGYVQASIEEPAQLIGKTNPRIEAAEELADGLSSPAIFWARFTKDIDQLMDVLGPRAVRYDGKLSDDENARSKEKFQKGEAQFFVANQAKGREGLTLTQAKTVVYYSNSFKLIDRLQSEDRAHRIGQDQPVNYIDFVAPGTVDERIVEALRDKFDIASQITGDRLKDWL